VFVLVEELHPRHLEVKFKFARRDPDCLQESLVVLCEHLTSIVPHGWVLVAHGVLVTIAKLQNEVRPILTSSQLNRRNALSTGS